MRKTFSRYIACLLGLTLLLGCSSGSSPLAPRSAAPAAAPPQMATVKFVITVPSASPGLKVAYVSASTQSASITVNGGTPNVANLNTGQPSYAISLAAPVGSDTFTVSLFDAANATGNILSTAQVTATITGGADNLVPLTTQGVPASIQLSVNNSSPRVGVPSTIVLTVAAKDAASNTIIGTYSNPISLTNSDTSGSLVLASNSRTSPGTVNVAYNGGNSGTVTLGATATGVPGGSITTATITPTVTALSNNGVVTTLAGHNASYFEGTGRIARFNGPINVAVDATGNVYVADFKNNVIRKITSTGVVTTLAGNGVPGNADGVGTSARFANPAGIAVDSNGNIVVADTGNERIRTITSAGVVTTLAGGANSGFADGTGTAALFNLPYDVAVDATGNIFVADTGNHRVRVVTAAGVVTSLAGNGTAGFGDGIGTGAQFKGPTGIDVDTSGNIFVSDTGNHAIRLLDLNGAVQTLAGNGTAGISDGTGTGAQFNAPVGIKFDGVNTLVIGDLNNNLIRIVDQNLRVNTVAGQPGGGSTNGTGTAATFNAPYGVDVDLNGNIYVADYNNNMIRKIDLTGGVTTLAGSNSTLTDGTGAAALFRNPYGIVAAASGFVLVTDTGNNAFRVVSPTGIVTTAAGQPAPGTADGTGFAAQFNSPAGIAIDINTDVFIADTGNNMIRKITSAGVVTTVAGQPTAGTANGTGAVAQFNAPGDVAVDANGNIFVSDGGNNMIRKIAPGGVVTTLAGSGVAGTSDGSGVAAQFNNPSGMGIDNAGNLIVSDFLTNRVRKISPSGEVTTLAGSGVAGTADGTGLAAEFFRPLGIEVDASGNIYVADTGNNRIRKITSGGVVTTLAGAIAPGTADGTGASASFSNPINLTVDANGVIYVTDFGNNLIRKIQ